MVKERSLGQLIAKWPLSLAMKISLWLEMVLGGVRPMGNGPEKYQSVLVCEKLIIICHTA